MGHPPSAYRNKRIMGVDLGFKSSPTVLALIRWDPDSGWILDNVLKLGPFLWYGTGDANLVIARRIIVDAIKFFFLRYNVETLVVEEPFLQGIGNKYMNKFLGVLEDELHTEDSPLYLAPTQIKKLLGSGKLSKEELAEAVKEEFEGDKRSIRLINKAIKNEDWDVTDAIAIALAGELYEGK